MAHPSEEHKCNIPDCAGAVKLKVDKEKTFDFPLLFFWFLSVTILDTGHTVPMPSDSVGVNIELSKAGIPSAFLGGQQLPI